MMHALPLVCLCVLTRSGAASADGPGPEVIKVEQDGDVILPCSNKQNMESGLFHWKKEKKEVFLYENGKHYNKDLDGQDEQFIGRVSYFQDQLKHGNASIIIRNTKMEDAGTYTCFFPPLQTPKTSIELVVGAVLKDRSGENIPGAAQKPFVTSFDESKDWSLLQCEAHGNPRPEVKWEDSSGNQLAADEPELSERGSSFYVKLNVTVKKTDRYRCVATQKNISHQTHKEIFERMNGGVQEPSVTILDEAKDWALLQCVVRGASPELRVEWEDSSGKTLLAHKPTFPVRGGYDIILNITVTQTDRYRCVATDKTNKRTETKIYVSVNGSSTGWIVPVAVGFFGGVSLIGVVLVVLVKYDCIKQNCKKSSSGNEGETKDTEEDPLKNSHSS